MSDFLMGFIQNPVDLIILLIIIYFMARGAKKGFIIFSLKGCYKLISVGGSFIIYPFITALMRTTPIFDMVSNLVKKSLNLQNVASSTQQQQIDTINSLALPQPIKTMLLDNNNSVIHSLLNVQNGVADYVSRYIANIILNICVGLIVYFIFSFVLRTIMKLGKFISKLPIISSFNAIAGGALGIAGGVIFVWVIFTVMNVFIANDFFSILNDKIATSYLGKYLYDNNLIWNIIKNNLFMR